MESLAAKFGVPFLSILFNHWWPVFLAIMLLISPFGPMYLGKPLIDGIFPRITDMWWSFVFDIALAIGATTLVWYCGKYLPADFRLGPTWVCVSLWVLSMAVGVAIGVHHFLGERGVANQDNPIAMYHNSFLYLALPTALGLPFFAVVKHLVQSPNMSAGVVVTIAVLCVLSWVGAGMYDFGIGGTPHDTNRDGVSKHALAHRKDWRNCRQPGYYKDLIPSLKYALFLPTDYRPTTH